MEKKILATIEEAVHNGDTAGANVLVIKDGKESAYCGYGMRDIENRLPIERDTIFRLYSQTKPITAAAAVSLMEKGKLDAGAWLSDYLPEYAVSYVRRNGERVPAHKHITVGDLLNMTSGIPYPCEDSEGGKHSGAGVRTDAFTATPAACATTLRCRSRTSKRRRTLRSFLKPRCAQSGSAA